MTEGEIEAELLRRREAKRTRLMAEEAAVAEVVAEVKASTKAATEVAKIDRDEGIIETGL